jgi:hypothetical protein
MEDSVAEEAEAINQKKKGTIQIVKLEFIEADTKDKEKHSNPIPG